MTIDVVITNDVSELVRIPVTVWQFLTVLIGSLSIISGFLLVSFKYGHKVGETKGYDIGYKAGHKKGFSDGKRDFFKNTKVLDNIICPQHPKKETLLNGINIIKRNDGTTVDVECPYINNDKTCQQNSLECIKLL